MLIKLNYLIIRGGSLKKIEKKIIPKVPTNKKVYTKASIKSKIYFDFFELSLIIYAYFI